MRDADVRPPLVRLIQETYPEALVLPELGLDYGLVRVDLAALSPARFHGYEVKADADTLRRLPTQALTYSAVLDRCTLVAGARHLERGQALVPSWWGLVLAHPGPDGVPLEEVRPAADNPSPNAGATLHLLWRAELLALLEAAGAARGLRSASKAQLLSRLVETLPGDALRDRVRQVVCARGDWRVASARP
ncbi:sce7726 family protein [Corallococcus exiguus]|uniref:sce7726 family protein n=1 Tax=Corallococcus exiguus TaxID=83462 RepID=UPI001471389D|nr:sce7726 family protein [Corallococcus exiguus]NNC17655.1 sce7726 family protein [Corallococcus exiguus]